MPAEKPHWPTAQKLINETPVSQLFIGFKYQNVSISQHKAWNDNERSKRKVAAMLEDSGSEQESQ